MRGILIAHKGPFVQLSDKNVQATFPHITFKRRVLVALGWNDPRTIRVIGQYARTAGLAFGDKAFLDEIVPRHWDGDGLIVFLSATGRSPRLYPPPGPAPAHGARRTQPARHRRRPGDGGQPGEAGQTGRAHFIERGHTPSLPGSPLQRSRRQRSL